MQSEFDKGSTNGFGWPWIVLALAFAGTMVPDPAQAATLTVINTNDSGAGSLRQAIANASDGDAITFDSTLAGSTITLTSGELVLDKDLSIEGDLNGDGAPDVTVSGNNTSRVFSVNSGAVASLEGLMITAGRAFEGGGIRNEGILILTNSTVSGNKALPGIGAFGHGPGGSGGGIFNREGTLTLTNSTVSENEALRHPGLAGLAGSGGGIFNREGTLMLTNSTVSDNRAEGGGGDGIFNINGMVTLTNSTVSDNSSVGISNGEGTVTLTNSTVSDNSSVGIFNREGTVTLTNSTVSDNSSVGIFNREGTVTLTNSTVSGNGAKFGGGISNESGTVTLTNSTVSGNRGGGGIHNSGTMTLTNSTVSGNETSPPPPLPLPPMGRSGGIFNAESGLLRIVNTIIANSITNGVEEGDCENNGTLDTANSANNLIETGCDVIATLTDNPELGPLQDNGGPTATHALMLGSPAIDFIPAADCEVTKDQRGVSRPQGFSCDIGAFEREVIPIPPGPPAPVPAVGKWALGILATLLLSAMVWLGRRQRRHRKG